MLDPYLLRLKRREDFKASIASHLICFLAETIAVFARSSQDYVLRHIQAGYVSGGVSSDPSDNLC